MSLNPSAPFATLWTTIDPIGNVALFAGLTAALTRSERHRTALRAVIYATISSWPPRPSARSVETRSLPTLTRSCPRRFTFYVAEPVSSILDAIGIHMHSLKVAGGIIETHSLPTL
jgi:hypothetical protein